MASSSGKSLAGNVVVDDGQGTTATPGAVPSYDASGHLPIPGGILLLPTTVAATGSGASDAASLTAGGFNFVTGADGTKGAIMTAAGVGQLTFIKNDDTANAILKVYPVSGGAINGVTTALSVAAKCPLILVNKTGTGAYSFPLLPS